MYCHRAAASSNSGSAVDTSEAAEPVETELWRKLRVGSQLRAPAPPLRDPCSSWMQRKQQATCQPAQGSLCSFRIAPPAIGAALDRKSSALAGSAHNDCSFKSAGRPGKCHSAAKASQPVLRHGETRWGFGERVRHHKGRPGAWLQPVSLHMQEYALKQQKCSYDGLAEESPAGRARSVALDRCASDRDSLSSRCRTHKHRCESCFG